MTMVDVTVIGGGLAGLACAQSLESRGRTCVVLEAGDAVGGRVRTDRVDGHLVDRGFQVLLDSYPELPRVVDPSSLGLRSFIAGARVRARDGWGRVTHPFRHPVAAVIDRFTGSLPWSDALALAPLAWRAMRGAPIAARGGATARSVFERAGVGAGTIDGFLAPFFAGVFLDPSMQADAAALGFRFSMFARGRATLSAQGMGALPAAMAARLAPGTIRLGTRVRGIDRSGTGWTAIVDGGAVQSRAIVLATDGPSTRALVPSLPERAWCSTMQFTFDIARAEAPAVMLSPILFLDGLSRGPVNHAAAVSVVQPSYAPAGRVQWSANVVDPSWLAHADGTIEAAVREQLCGWFGTTAPQSWRLLRAQRVEHALPRQHAGDRPPEGSASPEPGVILAGDQVGDASINGAIASGRHAAELAERVLAG
jgi:phytoene dehydrogenase-like protein